MPSPSSWPIASCAASAPFASRIAWREHPSDEHGVRGPAAPQLLPLHPDVTVADIYEHPVLADLAQTIQSIAGGGFLEYAEGGWLDLLADSLYDERRKPAPERWSLTVATARDYVGFVDQASVLDVGTGTGRILQVLAGHVGFGLGIDLSHDMLAVARANLDQREARNCQVRHGDMYQLPLPDGSFAAVTLHQVLHFADDPSAALAEAGRVLAPGGRLVVVDLAPHALERLRESAGHRRLGFGDEELARWFQRSGLVAEPPRHLTGPELTVVIWTARRPAAAVDDPTPIARRNAA